MFTMSKIVPQTVYSRHRLRIAASAGVNGIGGKAMQIGETRTATFLRATRGICLKIDVKIG